MYSSAPCSFQRRPIVRTSLYRPRCCPSAPERRSRRRICLSSPWVYSSPWPANGLPAPSMRLGSCLEPGDLDLLHLQHRLHDPFALFAIGLSEQLRQTLRHDLPREAIFVLEPAALDRLAAVRSQGGPEPVDLRLILATHRHRDRI